MKQCPNSQCAASDFVQINDVNFCYRCGTKLVLCPKNTINCERCGATIATMDKFCEGCGLPRADALKKKG